MRLFNKNILLALALLAVAQGCEKEPAGPKDTGVPIMLSATETGTKALLDNGTFNKRGNRIKVYDFVTDGNKTTKHIDSYAGPDVVSNSPLHVQGYTWPFTDEIDGTEADVKQWIPGTHKFFGWLAKDANFDDPQTENEDESMTAEAFFDLNENSFNETSKVLTIPAKAMTAGTTQFDFLYSNVVTLEPQNTPVNLEFSHLFTAFKITAINNSTNKIYLKSINVSNLKNNKSAIINYSSSNSSNSLPEVTYTDEGAVNGGFTYNIANDVELASDVATTISDYHLMWPQTDTDLDGVKVTVIYDYIENEKLTQNAKKEVYLSDLSSWDAGVKNSLNIIFKDKQLEVVVTPWNWESQEIDFTEVVTVSQTMKGKWVNTSSVNYDTGEVILKQKTDQVATVTFQIDTPVGATWTASLIMIEGATDAVQFYVDENGKSYKYGKVGEPGVVKLRVSKDTPIENRNSYFLRITVQTVDGNTIIVDEGLTELHKTSDNKHAEFKIIQNLIN